MDSEFVKSIETLYPFPIAATFRRVRTIDEDDIVNLHDSYGDLFEVFLKFLAIITLQDFRRSDRLPDHIDHFLKNILHPSLGNWNEIIRLITSEKTDNCVLAEKVSCFYKSKIDQDLKEYTEFIADALKSGIKLKTIKDVFDLLILYRNKVWKGHGAYYFT